MNKESTFGKIIEIIKEKTPNARARRKSEKEVEEAQKVTKVFDRAKEAQEYIFTISLQDYAANQGRNPSDYDLQQLFVHHQNSNEQYCVARCLGKMLDEIEKKNFEAVMYLRFNINRDSSLVPIGSPVKVVATGTALRLKADSEKQ